MTQFISLINLLFSLPVPIDWQNKQLTYLIKGKNHDIFRIK